jgi:hypothetical protein
MKTRLGTTHSPVGKAAFVTWEVITVRNADRVHEPAG